MVMVRLLEKGATYTVAPGDHFTLILPDGTMFNVEQTADDFSIVHSDGMVAYTTGTSAFAKEQESEYHQVTGRK